MEMIVSFLDFVNSLGINAYDAIIGFVMALVFLRHDKILSFVFNKYERKIKKLKHTSEKYTLDSADTINTKLEAIVMSDKRISSAILCNYHNSVSSNVDLSYYYFTSLTEAIGINSIHQCMEVWRERSYMNYQKELKMIHRSNCVIVNTNDKDDVAVYPKMAKLINDSGMKTGVFIPINMINKPIAFIVLLYEEEYFIKSKPEFLYKINKNIDDISILINYSKAK
jgi:hypothetical protein|nr:MAG TPA: hypothetical protein [Caudoviricetes sp.]